MSDSLSDWVVTPPLSPLPRCVNEKGAPSLSTTGIARLNLYFKLTRDAPLNPLFLDWIDDAWLEDPVDTLTILFHGRDCRGGKGDRTPFLEGLFHLLQRYPTQVSKCIPLIPEHGRFLDWVQLLTMIRESRYDNQLYDITYKIIECIAEQLKTDLTNMQEGKSISLLAKWLPSEGKKWDRRTNLVRQLTGYIYKVPQKQLCSDHLRQFRQEYQAPLRAYLKLVEGYMCSGRWDEIEFSKVPSVAMHRLKAAFMRHEPERFAEWLADVKGGRKKINSSQVYPHELVAKYLNSEHSEHDEVIEAQWNSMVDGYKEKRTLKSALVVCDVSGSMVGLPMQVAIALGILISQITHPTFRGQLITFSEDPELHQLDEASSLYDKVKSVKGMGWGMNTNLQKVFELILDHARDHGLDIDEMPKRLFILSDMQFDQACLFSGGSPHDKITMFEHIRATYSDAGYTMPEIIFWNIRSDTTMDFPVQYDEQGVALVSGFSPSILTQIMEAEELSPWGIMRAVLDSKRYAPLREALF
jgi:hypothetical protein